MNFLYNLPPEIIALLGTLVGASATILVTIVQKYYENKKTFREAFINAGIKNWEGSKDMALAQRDVFSGNLAPLDIFIIHHSKLLKLIEKDEVSVENLEKIQKEIRELSDTVAKHTIAIKKKKS